VSLHLLCLSVCRLLTSLQSSGGWSDKTSLQWMGSASSTVQRVRGTKQPYCVLLLDISSCRLWATVAGRGSGLTALTEICVPSNGGFNGCLGWRSLLIADGSCEGHACSCSWREHAVSVVVRVRVCACQMQTPFKPTVSQPWPSVSSGAASCMAQVWNPGCVLGN
jgi:hypothetical protein